MDHSRAPEFGESTGSIGFGGSVAGDLPSAIESVKIGSEPNKKAKQPASTPGYA